MPTWDHRLADWMSTKMVLIILLSEKCPTNDDAKWPKLTVYIWNQQHLNAKCFMHYAKGKAP